MSDNDCQIAANPPVNTEINTSNMNCLQEVRRKQQDLQDQYLMATPDVSIAVTSQGEGCLAHIVTTYDQNCYDKLDPHIPPYTAW
jgi:hypothetical protein